MMLALTGPVALSFNKGADAGLAALDGLEQDLPSYQPYYAAKADFHRRLGQAAKAREAYMHAIELSRNVGERLFLQDRMETLKDRKDQIKQHSANPVSTTDR